MKNLTPYTMKNLQEIKNLENELKLKSMLGREYFSDEATEMKLRLQELRMKEMINGII